MEDGGFGSARASNLSSSTFRDTPVGQESARDLMKTQSLASIVNNPKKASLVSKMASLVKSKVTGSG